MTPDQIQQIIERDKDNIAQEQNAYANITAAAANGTLHIQRATDVDGLNYIDSSKKFTELSGGNGYELASSQKGGYNTAYLQQHSNDSYLMDVNGLGVYFSW